MSEQERLAEDPARDDRLYRLSDVVRDGWIEGKSWREIAAAILDSDVIREIRAEAAAQGWDRCVSDHRLLAGSPVSPINPYLPTCHPRGVEKQ